MTGTYVRSTAMKAGIVLRSSLFTQARATTETKTTVVCIVRRTCRIGLDCRFLREHARKAMKEEKAFLKTLRAEAKAKEDR